jgi:polyisoprenoid-binding protein YceI
VAWLGSAAACAVLAAHAQPESYVVDPAHTFASFGVDHLGIATQRGRFDRSRGRIVLDRESGQGLVEIEIDAASISTGNPKIDALLRSEDFFDVERHPHIAYRATRLAFEAGQLARVDGELTLLGVTRPVAIAIARTACTVKPFLVRTTCGADGAARFSRADFGMKGLAAFIGDEVRIDVQVEAVRQEPAAPPGASQGG